MAQSPANRTNKTIVADVLAQLPANNQEIFNRQFADLASTGEEGVFMLIEMLKGSDAGSIVLAEYALNGLAAYASADANTAVRTALIQAYTKGLLKVTSVENKKFLIRQLYTMGANVSIEGEALPTPVVEAGLKSDNPTKDVLNAIKKADRVERNRVLNLASQDANESMYIAVLKAINKAKPDVKSDVLNWMGREAASDPAKRKTLQDMEVKLDQPARNVLIGFLQDPAYEVKEAAIWTLTKIGDARVIPVIADLLAGKDQKVIAMAERALASFPGDISQSVSKVITKSSDEGKIAGLRLLALRKSDVNSTTVYKQLTDSSPLVKQAAYQALKDVVNNSDFVRLCGMLETAQADEIAPIQEAIIASIASQSPAEQAKMVNARIIRAGIETRSLYYKVLAATGDAKGLKTIVEGFNNDKGSAKEQAFEALLRWKGSETTDALYNIAKDPASTTYFDRAIDAYIRLAANPALSPENRLIGLRKAMEIAKTPAQKNTILRQIGQTGTFTAMIFAGNYLNEKAIQESAAQAVMKIALGNKDFTGKVVRDLLGKVIDVLNNPDAGYQKEAIRKHLGEMPQEEGYVSIFNGKDLTGWKGLVGNPISRAKMTAAQMKTAQEKADVQMRNDWKVEKGVLLFDGTGYDNLCTVKKYGDIEMYIDWMLDPAGPEADAGIYLRGTPQVQMWDTARVNVGAQVGSGGLYNNKVHESKPSKVADNKMGEWNTFYIKMVGDRVTVVLNGEKVVDNVILENYWDRNLPILALEQLELQAHGSKVYYRDIYVKELPMVEPFQLSAAEKKEGYKILFDGTNMHEWIGNTVDYTMDEGTISLVPSRGSGGNLYSRKEYGNFVFRFEFQLTPAANNGLGIRTPMEGDAAYVGMELQILDNEHPVYKDLEKYQYHGSVYGIIAAQRGYLKPVGEWNYQEVIANGDRIKITLNGHVIVDGNIREATKNGTPDKKEHPGLFNKKGHIGFLGHGSPVKFRNIRIKELK
ncbi:family 16 glycoside hydrolase [Bacteroides sp. 519]|uniref:family 16 glycoside hydrolase n=1 Tax=Bacteroides sp. 519 TaxID=2302937 RepID=UPI00351A0A6E